MHTAITRGKELPDHVESKEKIGTTFRAAHARLVIFEHRNTDVVALIPSPLGDILVAGEAERTERHALINTLRNFMTGQCDLQFTLAMSTTAKTRIERKLKSKCPHWILERVFVLEPDEFNKETILESIHNFSKQTRSKG